ncbi:MAG: hypothetical protein HYZ48_02130 [Chlamydiales bacterium]|nr:hypothetical protein [Chlamydiales bacterium]
MAFQISGSRRIECPQSVPGAELPPFLLEKKGISTLESLANRDDAASCKSLFERSLAKIKNFFSSFGGWISDKLKNIFSNRGATLHRLHEQITLGSLEREAIVERYNALPERSKERLMDEMERVFLTKLYVGVERDNLGPQGQPEAAAFSRFSDAFLKSEAELETEGVSAYERKLFVEALEPDSALKTAKSDKQKMRDDVLGGFIRNERTDFFVDFINRSPAVMLFSVEADIVGNPDCVFRKALSQICA